MKNMRTSLCLFRSFPPRVATYVSVICLRGFMIRDEEEICRFHPRACISTFYLLKIKVNPGCNDIVHMWLVTGTYRITNAVCFSLFRLQSTWRKTGRQKMWSLFLTSVCGREVSTCLVFTKYVPSTTARRLHFVWANNWCTYQSSHLLVHTSC